jgi:hypothetical protein
MDKYVIDSFSFASLYSALFLSFLLVSGVWLVDATMNVDVLEMEGMIELITNVISVFTSVMMSQMIIVQAGKMDDTGQVRPQYPHFISE